MFFVYISYYFDLQVDILRHSFPLNGLFILIKVFGILLVFNEASKKLYIDQFSQLRVARELLGGRG